MAAWTLLIKSKNTMNIFLIEDSFGGCKYLKYLKQNVNLEGSQLKKIYPTKDSGLLRVPNVPNISNVNLEES